MEKLKKLWANKPLIGLILFVVIVSMINPRFLTAANFLNVLRQTSINSVIAIGMTFVILTGGIDLSVGSVLAFTGALCASLLGSGLGAVPAVLSAIGAGFLLGACSGFFVAYARLQPFIVTLISMTFLRGATLVFTNGRPIPARGGEELFEALGGGSILNVPVPIIVMVILFTAGQMLLSRFRFGRYVYAIGGNEEAARLSGIDTARVKTLVYGLSGALAALAGVIVTSRLGSAQPTAGTGYELDAIAAVVLGGASLAGGSGRVSGTALGVLIMGVLGNALNLLNVTSYYQMMIQAAVILAAVLIDKRRSH